MLSKKKYYMRFSLCNDPSFIYYSSFFPKIESFEVLFVKRFSLIKRVLFIIGSNGS